MKLNWIVVGASLCVAGSLIAAEPKQAPSRNARPAAVVLASSLGAALDSDLMRGGGTDDTAVLQAALDRAAEGGPVHLIVDGPALVGGLTLHGNTILECLEGGGLYLKRNSNRALVRNAHRSREAIRDEHITVRGCFFNGNRDGQPTAPNPRYPMLSSNREADGSFIVGLQFHGVNDLTIEDVTLWNIRSFAVDISNAHRIEIRNVIVDHGGPPDFDASYLNTDGLHFGGPVRYVTIDGVKVRTGDDGIAFNANDGGTEDMRVKNDLGPFVGQGPITDVTVNNVVVMEAAQAFRFLSSTQRIDRVSVSNVTGTLKGLWIATIGHYMTPSHPGNMGSITFNNINVSRCERDAKIAGDLTALVRAAKSNAALFDEMNAGIYPLFNVNAHMDNLIISNFSTAVADDRPIIRFGGDARVRMMTVEMNIDDPQLNGVPLELDAGSRIERLNLTVNWRGPAVDRGKNPIVSHGGVIERLNWVGTPPMYVGAELSAPKIVVVTFTQEVKANDFKSGVRIAVNGRAAAVSRVAHGPERMDKVSYILSAAIRADDHVTWGYDAAEGNIQNLSGRQLLAVSDQLVVH